MKAVSNGNRMEPIGLEALNLGESIKLNGGNITIEHNEKVIYVDQRPIERTKWQIFSEAFAHSVGWTAGASVVTYVGCAVFRVVSSSSKN
ncbi:MAG: hypothetical protein ACRDAI_01810 [Candidatus Rhabdochlamydia sp.]